MAPRAKTVLFFFAFAVVFASGQYVLDDSVGLGRKFDGIGGLSAGASSRLLSNYPQEQLGQILDYLFKPNFGAALQILKVEIGGDAQSTDGTESSHMHSRDEENYQTGYEWMLMVEAKKRNPNIKLYGLSWGFPAWVGNGSGSPYKFPNQTAEYVVKWVLGAKKYYNLDIDYVGIWNERSYDSTYIKVLRHLLDENGLQHTRIVAHDGGWDIAGDILKDPDLANAVDIIGAHYPGTTSSSDAAMTGKQLWASEDYSTYNDLTGGGCWARLLNQNYINGNMTSTITWNLIASYYSGLPFYRDGLMTAAHPWTGHYDVESPIWGSAHTTQFTQLGWSYLKHGYGVGHLEKGGSYVTLISPDKKDCTIVIETMSHDHSVCVRPRLPPYSVANQTANFELKGSLANIKILHMWRTHHDFTGNGTNYFERTSDIELARGKFTISLDVDSIWTLSTTTGQKKGNYTNVPNPAPFPVPYHDDFDSYAEYSEAANFADQSGVFEIYDTKSSHGKVMRQVVLERPITWCNDANQPISLLGDQSWQDVNVSVEGMVEKNTSVFVAARVHTGGCGIAGTDGFFLWLSSDGPFTITSDLAGKKVLSKGDGHGKAGQWFTLFIHVLKQTAIAMINGEIVYQTDSFTGSSSGWAAIGTSSFDYAQFDNFYVNSSALPCLSQPSAGQSVVMSARSTIKMWQMNADGTIQLVNTSFCLDVSGKTSAGGLNVVIEKCQSGSSTQTYLYEKARMLLKLKQSNNCLEIMNMDTSEGAEVELWPCNGGANQQWLIPSGPGLINIQLDNTYLAVCH